MVVRRKTKKNPNRRAEKKLAAAQQEVTGIVDLALRLKDPVTGITLPKPPPVDLADASSRADFIRDRLSAAAVIALERKVNSLLDAKPGSKAEQLLTSELLDRAGFTRRPNLPTVSTGPVIFVGPVPSPYENEKVIEVQPEIQPEVQPAAPEEAHDHEDADGGSDGEDRSEDREAEAEAVGWLFAGLDPRAAEDARAAALQAQSAGLTPTGGGEPVEAAPVLGGGVRSGADDKPAERAAGAGAPADEPVQ